MTRNVSRIEWDHQGCDQHCQEIFPPVKRILLFEQYLYQQRAVHPFHSLNFKTGFKLWYVFSYPENLDLYLYFPYDFAVLMITEECSVSK